MAKAKKEAAAKSPKEKKKSRSVKKQEAAIEAQNTLFKELSEKMGQVKAQPYRMASIYPVDSVIEHPKFGLGFVSVSWPDKIEVVFQDVNRHLVQGRK